MLSIAGKIYGKVMSLRNSLYQKGFFRSHDLGKKVISVGNITAGGTGKTPLTALVAKILFENDEKVCILTRGYGRKNPKDRVIVSDGTRVLADAETAGDEPFELAQMLIGKASVIADADRVGGATLANRELNPTVFLLDDGFQHRRVKRDIDIVCIDATDPFGGNKMLPSGRLRERLDGLKRADIIVLTRADLAKDIDETQEKIRAIVGTAPIFRCESLVMGVVPLSEFLSGSLDPRPVDEFVSDLRPGAFCGLGNPNNFYKKLEAYLHNSSSPSNLLFSRSFRDHHKYSSNDVKEIVELAERNAANAIFTTPKDAVKLSSANFAVPCFVIISEPVIDDPVRFEQLITA